jgi:hypothetical protein
MLPSSCVIALILAKTLCMMRQKASPKGETPDDQ